MQAKVSAINPVCNVMNFEYKYGEEICSSTCGVPAKYKPISGKRIINKPEVSTTTTTTTMATTILPRTINETCEEYGTDYLGNDLECLKGSATSWEECAKLCNDNARCSHWTYVPGWACCTKTSDAGRVTNGRTKDMVSGSRACGACEEINTDLLGNDVDAVLNVSTWEQCSHICKQRSDCSFWTWVGDKYTIDTNRGSMVTKKIIKIQRSKIKIQRSKIKKIDTTHVLHKCHLKNGDSGRAQVTGLISGSSECGDCKLFKQKLQLQ